MAKIDADPLDGPTIDTSRPLDSGKRVAMYMAGAGVFFALLAASQATVQPLVQSGLDMIPGVNSGGDSGGVTFGNPEQ